MTKTVKLESRNQNRQTKTRFEYRIVMGYYLTEQESASSRPARHSLRRPRTLAKSHIGAPLGGAILSAKYWDVDTKLLAYQLRDYGPGMGRWAGRDPSGEDKGHNLHHFTFNNPINIADILGLKCCMCINVSYVLSPLSIFDESLPSLGIRTYRAGIDIDVIWSVDGDSEGCKVYQEETDGIRVTVLPSNIPYPVTFISGSGGEVTFAERGKGYITYTDKSGAMFQATQSGPLGGDYRLEYTLNVTFKCRSSDDTEMSSGPYPIRGKGDFHWSPITPPYLRRIND